MFFDVNTRMTKVKIMSRIAAEAVVGHVLPVASINEFLQTPGGLRHVPTKTMPSHVSMLVVSKTKPKPETFNDIIRVHHDTVTSCCDSESHVFAMEAMCTLADMFAYNLGDGKPRFVVGTLRQTADKKLVFTVARVFTLDMDLDAAKELHMTEIEMSLKRQVRRGQKQKADVLMTETPMKRPYKPAA